MAVMLKALIGLVCDNIIIIAERETCEYFLSVNKKYVSSNEQLQEDLY